jgi:biofilm PGA synthesis N-glycosyltransferase PgaC
MSIQPPMVPVQRLLALLIPAHNEELLLAATIQSAIDAGQNPNDIYVVDDNSHDNTTAIAAARLGKGLVLKVGRSGKAMAVQKAIAHFDLAGRYEWLHVSDADSVFGQHYFTFYKNNLDRHYAAAVGVVQSHKGNWICTYRAFSYTYGQMIIRRIQSWFDMISVLPGPVTCFRTDILDKLDFDTTSLTEDFDITLQLYRKKLGRIKFIPSAVSYTQDPRTLKDFWAQTLRWSRGFFQGVKKYRIGLRPQRIDISIGITLVETTVYLLQLFILYPLLAINHNAGIAQLLAYDVLMYATFAMFAALYLRKPTVLIYFPLFYILKALEVAAFLLAAIEILLLGKFKEKVVGWSTEGRRYALES